jgi:predicted phosphodiesterase
LRFAVISDVHSNLPALDAVLEHVDAQGVDGLIFLGDHVSGPVDPAGTADRIMARGGVAIAGNHRFARSRLSEGQIAWLAGLRGVAEVGTEIFACHGTPRDDEAPWLDNFYDGRSTTLPSEEQVARHADGIDREVLLCGHTHIARTLRLRDGRLIANPGSVGMQLLRGSPDAHYALIEKTGRGWLTALIGVPYDADSAAQTAEANGFPGWGEAIRHGWSGPDTLG